MERRLPGLGNIPADIRKRDEGSGVMFKTKGPLAGLRGLFSRVMGSVDQPHQVANIELQAEFETILQGPGPLLILHLHEGHLLLSAELSKRRIGFVRIANNPERHHAKLRRAGIDGQYAYDEE